MPTAVPFLPVRRGIDNRLHPAAEWLQEKKVTMPTTALEMGDFISQLFAVMPTAPGSWWLGPRQIQPSGNKLAFTWLLPVAELKQAAQLCMQQKRIVEIQGPCSTPLGGTAWNMLVCCTWQSDPAPGRVRLAYVLPPRHVAE